jgi:tetratricopeptide (TPR) repeat protein
MRLFQIENWLKVPMKEKQFFFISILFLLYTTLFAQDNFTEGESLFLRNKPQDALGFLEAAVTAQNAPLQAFLYLGMVYQQLDRLDDAIAVYKKILPNAEDGTALTAYSLGNVYYSKEDFPSAEACYTQAIEADPAFASAYLNRANARLQRGGIEEAVADYTQYLSLDTESAKKPQIEILLAAIQKAADEEAAAAKRKAGEEAAAIARAEEQEQRARESIPAILAALQDMEDIAAAIRAREGAAAESGEVNNNAETAADAAEAPDPQPVDEDGTSDEQE